ncbi:hypothetical protein KJ909_02235, partial [Patescibacteria group bacterium]|nr:hypothetical protein [Patescibacteria group bacterium]
MVNIFSKSVMGSDGVESGGEGINLKVVGGVILVLVLLVFGWIRLRSNTATISVIGTGEVEMIPETVSMIVTKVSSAGDATGAIDAGEAGISRLIATVRSTVG